MKQVLVLVLLIFSVVEANSSQRTDHPIPRDRFANQRINLAFSYLTSGRERLANFHRRLGTTPTELKSINELIDRIRELLTRTQLTLLWRRDCRVRRGNGYCDGSSYQGFGTSFLDQVLALSHLENRTDQSTNLKLADFFSILFWNSEKQEGANDGLTVAYSDDTAHSPATLVIRAERIKKRTLCYDVAREVFAAWWMKTQCKDNQHIRLRDCAAEVSKVSENLRRYEALHSDLFKVLEGLQFIAGRIDSTSLDIPRFGRQEDGRTFRRRD